MSKLLKSLTLVLSLTAVVMGAAACSPKAPIDAKKATPSSLIGNAAPDFTLPAAGGQDVSLSDYRGKKAVLLYFSMGPG